MPRTKNDGKGKTGGRQKGVPNKVTTTIREYISELIDDNRKQIKKDLRALEPKERLQILERLMAYVTPKVQAVDISAELSPAPSLQRPPCEMTTEELEAELQALKLGKYSDGE